MLGRSTDDGSFYLNIRDDSAFITRHVRLRAVPPHTVSSCQAVLVFGET